MKTPDISIIIPVFQEEKTICETLDTLRKLNDDAAAEIIVVDGDPQKTTIRGISGHPAIKTLAAPKGRGRQMNAGADIARGEILLFLHADTRLPEGALARIRQAVKDRNIAAGAFELGIDAPGPAFRIIERMASWRSRLTRIPYGDQAIFIKHPLFRELGGYRPLSIMEDINLMQRIKESGSKIKIIRQKVHTSARRWEKEGVLACTLRNWVLSSAYYLGVPPEKLKRYYT